MNPFELKPKKYDDTVMSFQSMYPKSYDKDSVDPFTKLRIILMNGTEYEAVKHQHAMHRTCNNNDIRRDVAMMRRIEQQQQKKISMLKPRNESILEHTLSYEQLAVDLTCILAQREPDMYVKQALDFALLEDFDHLYRYSDLLEMEEGGKPEKLIGELTEIMPGRPTISEHRHPADSVRRFVSFKTCDPITALNTMIITAAEQQTMNYYMNNGMFYTASDLGRQLYSEIAMIEEQHVTQYGSLMDPTLTPFECMLMHEYGEAYLYYSCYQDETDKRIRKIWEEMFEQEVLHLHMAADLLKKYERKDWQQVIPVGDFPELLKFHSNKEYIRGVLESVQLTAKGEDYCNVCDLPDGYRFYQYQGLVNLGKTTTVATHNVIKEYIRINGEDYRYQVKEHPIKELRSRTKDNTNVGRCNIK